MVPFAVVSGKSIIAGTSVAFCGSDVSFVITNK